MCRLQVLKREIFGPIIPILAVASVEEAPVKTALTRGFNCCVLDDFRCLDQAIGIINRVGPKPLIAYCYTKDSDACQRGGWNFIPFVTWVMFPSMFRSSCENVLTVPLQTRMWDGWGTTCVVCSTPPVSFIASMDLYSFHGSKSLNQIVQKSPSSPLCENSMIDLMSQ